MSGRIDLGARLGPAQTACMGVTTRGVRAVTADVSTLPGVMEDLRQRFGVGRIALVADRGLISEDNLALVGAHGFDHVLATRLHNHEDVTAVLEQAD